jgi:hypothetical protein
VRVLLGNSAAKEAYLDAKGTLRHKPLEGARVTTVHIPDTYSLLEAVAVVTAQDGVWNHHSRGDNVTDSTPDWVESDNGGLAMLLAAQLGCPVGRPDDWDGEG